MNRSRDHAVRRRRDHGARTARDADQSVLRQFGALAHESPGWRQLQQFHTRVPQHPPTKGGWKERASLARGGARFLPSGPYPERFSGPCLRARSPDSRLSCPRWSSRASRFGWLGLDELELVFLDLLRGPTQLLAPGCP